MIYTLPDSVLASAQKSPDKVAFTDGKQTLTYSELLRRMNQLANALLEAGLQKGDRVGVYNNRGLETGIAIYAIMRAGGIYVPLDTGAPPQLTRYLLEDCGIQILISHPSQRRKLKALLSEVTPLQTLIGWTGAEGLQCSSWEQLAEKNGSFQSPFPILEMDPAYIIYTSGSTGNPKGMVHTHYSGLSYARLTADLYDIDESDRIANHAPVFFDISLLGYFTGPLVGATTLIIPDAYIALPASLSQLIEKERLTIWYSVPLALTQLLQRGVLEERDMSSLRWVLYAGEPFPPKYLRELMLQWPNARYSNIYGPAETNQCTYYNIPDPPQGDDPIPIGQVWGNTEALIFDEEGQQVAEGEVGELLIRSATLMEGYWQRPDLTQKAMYIRTNAAGFEERFYRTGDLVRIDEQGRMQFLGRKDHQIKTRGYRVELDAVEAILVAHESVAEAVVFPVPKEDDTIAIGAAVTLKETDAADEQLLRQYLQQQLPFYAVPESIRILESFPRTGSGKINRPAIKADLINV
ncbi:MAG: amino acid adenylation domain-containing protein [Bacteroidota bacterium]